MPRSPSATTFIIAGDFNTQEITHATIMGNMVRRNVCTSSWKAFRQVHGKSGDMGFHSGERGNVLATQVDGHDPRHFPYAFRWGRAPSAATEHRACSVDAEEIATEPAKEDKPPSAKVMTQPADVPTSLPAAPEQVATRLAHEDIAHLERHATVQAAVPQESSETLQEEAAEPAAAEHGGIQKGAEPDLVEHRQRQHAEVPARIVHAFLDGLPTTDHEADSIIWAILENEEKMPDESLKAIAVVFEPAFIWYTDPYERTEFVHRDTHSFVRAWQWLAGFRDAVGADEFFDGMHLSTAQRQTVFQAYLSHFASAGLKPGQDHRRMKSYAEAHLKQIAANRMIAFLIWEVGVPKITPAAEQRDIHLQEGALAADERADALEATTMAILNWLDAAARCILFYKQTKEYCEARRRAGPRRGTPGISTEEQAQTVALRKEKANVRKGRRLANLWSLHAVTYATLTWPDWTLLQNYWDGTDMQRVFAIQRQRGDPRITMPTLRNDLPQK